MDNEEILERLDAIDARLVALSSDSWMAKARVDILEGIVRIVGSTAHLGAMLDDREYQKKVMERYQKILADLEAFDPEMAQKIQNLFDSAKQEMQDDQE